MSNHLPFSHLRRVLFSFLSHRRIGADNNHHTHNPLSLNDIGSLLLEHDPMATTFFKPHSLASTPTPTDQPSSVPHIPHTVLTGSTAGFWRGQWCVNMKLDLKAWKEGSCVEGEEHEKEGKGKAAPSYELTVTLVHDSTKRKWQRTLCSLPIITGVDATPLELYDLLREESTTQWPSDWGETEKIEEEKGDPVAPLQQKMSEEVGSSVTATKNEEPKPGTDLRVTLIYDLGKKGKHPILLWLSEIEVGEDVPKMKLQIKELQQQLQCLTKKMDSLANIASAQKAPACRAVPTKN